MGAGGLGGDHGGWRGRTGHHEPWPPWENNHSGNKIPKMNFPKFDGENPRLWITWCEDYFDLYSVKPAVWIKCAMMNFVNSSPVARWLQSLDPQVKKLPWKEFC